MTGGAAGIGAGPGRPFGQVRPSRELFRRCGMPLMADRRTGGFSHG